MPMFLLLLLVYPQFLRFVFSTRIDFANPNKPISPEFLQMRHACEQGNRQLALSILKHGYDNRAISFSKVEVRQFLALTIAKNHSDIIDDILKTFSKDEVFTHDYLHSFLSALDVNHLPTLLAFLKHYPNLIHWVIDQGTLYHKKSLSNHAQKLKDGTLLQHAFRLGADAENEGNTFPLRHAILAGMWKYAEILIENGAYTNIFIQHGMPLKNYLANAKQDDLLSKILLRNETLDAFQEYGAKKTSFFNWVFETYFRYRYQMWLLTFINTSALIYYRKTLFGKNKARLKEEIDAADRLAMSKLFQDVFREFFRERTQSNNPVPNATFSVYAEPIHINRICRISPDKDFNLTLSFDRASLIILKHLQLPNALQLREHGTSKTTIDLTAVDCSWIKSANKNKIIQSIRHEIYDEMKKTAAYRSQKSAYELLQREKNKQQLKLQRLRFRDVLIENTEKYKADLAQQIQNINIVVNLATLEMDFIAKNKSPEWLASKRIQKPLELLIKECDKYNEIVATNLRLDFQNLATKYQQLAASLQDSDLPMEQLKVIQSDHHASLEFLQNRRIFSTQFKKSLEKLHGDLLDAIAKHENDMQKAPKICSISQTLEEKKLQKAREEQQRQAEQSRLLAENEEKKRAHRIQLEEQRKQKEIQKKAELEKQERRRLAEIKRLEEIQKSQSTSSQATSSISLKPILKEKVITLGDLIQRAENEVLTEHARIQYRYALLAQCLRLFELTDKYLHSKISFDIRNALMHQHRYFDLAALIELADLIAHRPNSSASTSTPKFEDILIDLRQQASSQLKAQLRHSLMALTLSNFYKTIVQNEVEQPSAIQYLESIVHFIEDLQVLNVKLEQGLFVNPDKILAIQGILMCIGECFQRLKHLRQDELLTENQNADFVFFIKAAKDIRDQMAHTVEEPLEIEGLYLKFIRQAEGYKNSAETILHSLKFDEDIESPSLKFN